MRLPDGSPAKDRATYVDRWNIIADTIARKFNLDLYSFDPGFHFTSKDVNEAPLKISGKMGETLYYMIRGEDAYFVMEELLDKAETACYNHFVTYGKTWTKASYDLYQSLERIGPELERLRDIEAKYELLLNQL